MEELFERFGSYLEGMGYQAKGGQMVEEALQIELPFKLTC
jgi:hypothetical protein